MTMRNKRFLAPFLLSLFSITPPSFAMDKMDKCEPILAGMSPKLLWTEPLREIGGSATPDSLSAFLIDRYKSDPAIAKVLASDEYLKPAVLRIEPNSQDVYRAVVEIAYERRGRISFGYFPAFFRIYDIVIDKDQFSVFDMTSANLPRKKLWAHYKVTTGDMPPAKDSNKLSVRKIHGQKIYYRAMPDKSDVYIPLSTPELELAFRHLLLSPTSPSLFWIRHDGKITLNSMTPEAKARMTREAEARMLEADGNLAFGLRGGGATGWGPWNAKFVEIVDKVKGQAYDKVAPANESLLPPSAR